MSKAPRDADRTAADRIDENLRTPGRTIRITSDALRIASDALRIAIIGDFNPASRYHLATNAAIQHAAAALACPVELTWLPTPELEDAPSAKQASANLASTKLASTKLASTKLASMKLASMKLSSFDGLWCAPGSPYASMAGALHGIRYAREHGIPFTGT